MAEQRSFQWISLHDKISGLKEAVFRKTCHQIRQLRSCTFVKFKRILSAKLLILSTVNHFVAVSPIRTGGKIFKMCNYARIRFQGFKRESVGKMSMRLERLEAVHLPNSKGIYLHVPDTITY